MPSLGIQVSINRSGTALFWQVVNRIAIEELEAWYFGNWPAVVATYPNVPENIPGKAPYRNPDAIAGDVGGIRTNTC